MTALTKQPAKTDILPARNKTVLQLIVAAGLPMLCAFAMGMVTIFGDVGEAFDGRHTAASAGFSQNAAKIITELQKERGMSAGFLASKGKSFADELPAQQSRTDQALGQHRDLVADFDVSFLTDSEAARAKASIKDAMSTIGRLSGIRASVASRELSAGEAVSTYTGAIVALLSAIETLNHHIQNDDMRRMATNHENLLWAQELGGRERAAGAAGFGIGAFDAPQFARFQALGSQQQLYLDRLAKRVEDPQAKAAVAEMTKSPEFQNIEAYRGIVMESLASGDLKGKSASDWFGTSTAYLGTLVKTGNLFAARRVEEANAHSASVGIYALAGIVGLLVLLAVVSFTTLRTTRRATRSLMQICTAMDKADAGDDSFEIEGRDRGDLFAVIGGRLEEFARKSVTNTRITTALETASMLTMIADNDRNIVYMNEPLKKALKEAEGEIRKQLPQFNADQLVGTKIDIFHRRPEHQKEMVGGLSSQHRAEITIGGREYALAISPVTHPGLGRLGTVVEWRDVTIENRAIREVDQVIEAAVHGDFSGKANVDGLEGALQAVGKRVNTLVKTIDTSFAEAARAIGAMAKGDLSRRMEGSFEGTFATLQNDLNATIGHLSGLIDQLSTTAETIQQGSASISASAIDLSSRAERQAAALEETSATMEEMSATIRTSADGAGVVQDMSREASGRASTGTEVVRQTVEAMDKIEKSSNRISEIVSVIDSIAFQTNLLALNAAVEAARAGDAGKGFAVVAQEVRTLAQRASDAAKDIGELISESNGFVTNGVELVQRTGTSLEQIVEAIAGMVGKVEEITSATKEQSLAVEQVTSGVCDMDQATQETAALAERCASASRQLAHEGDELNRAMSFFSKTTPVAAESRAA